MDEIYSVDENGYITVEEETAGETETQGVEMEVPVFPEAGQDGNPADVVWPSFSFPDLEEPPALIVPYSADAAPVALADPDIAPAADAVYQLDGMVVYDVQVSSYGACKAVFTPAQADNVTVEAGQLVNWSSSDIRVPLYRGDPADRPAASTLSLTLLGRGASNFANNYYRYGTAQYVTSYYVNGSSLSSTNTYVAISDVEQKTYSRQYWLWVVIVVCLLIMAVNGLIRFLRRGHRG